jgi:hypothetical protein
VMFSGVAIGGAFACSKRASPEIPGVPEDYYTPASREVRGGGSMRQVEGVELFRRRSEVAKLVGGCTGG